MAGPPTDGVKGLALGLKLGIPLLEKCPWGPTAAGTKGAALGLKAMLLPPNGMWEGENEGWFMAVGENGALEEVGEKGFLRLYECDTGAGFVISR